MKNNIMKNIQLDNREKIYKDFRKLNAKGYNCQILLTTKRLIIYSKGFWRNKGKKSKQKRMNEIDLNSIHRLEYYIDYIKNNIWVRLIGFLVLLGGLAAGYFLFMGTIPVPSFVPAVTLPYAKYAFAGLIAIIGMIMMFRTRKTLHLIIESHQSKTHQEFDVTKYNELAIRYLASKIRPN